jgi:hypothetical protein
MGQLFNDPWAPGQQAVENKAPSSTHLTAIRPNPLVTAGPCAGPWTPKPHTTPTHIHTVKATSYLVHAVDCSKLGDNVQEFCYF